MRLESVSKLGLKFLLLLVCTILLVETVVASGYQNCWSNVDADGVGATMSCQTATHVRTIRLSRPPLEYGYNSYYQLELHIEQTGELDSRGRLTWAQVPGARLGGGFQTRSRERSPGAGAAVDTDPNPEPTPRDSGSISALSDAESAAKRRFDAAKTAYNRNPTNLAVQLALAETNAEHAAAVAAREQALSDAAMERAVRATTYAKEHPGNERVQAEAKRHMAQARQDKADSDRAIAAAKAAETVNRRATTVARLAQGSELDTTNIDPAYVAALAQQATKMGYPELATALQSESKRLAALQPGTDGKSDERVASARGRTNTRVATGAAKQEDEPDGDREYITHEELLQELTDAAKKARDAKLDAAVGDHATDVLDDLARYGGATEGERILIGENGAYARIQADGTYQIFNNDGESTGIYAFRNEEGDIVYYHEESGRLANVPSDVDQALRSGEMRQCAGCTAPSRGSYEPTRRMGESTADFNKRMMQPVVIDGTTYTPIPGYINTFTMGKESSCPGCVVTVNQRTGVINSVSEITGGELHQRIYDTDAIRAAEASGGVTEREGRMYDSKGNELEYTWNKGVHDPNTAKRMMNRESDAKASKGDNAPDSEETADAEELREGSINNGELAEDDAGQTRGVTSGNGDTAATPMEDPEFISIGSGMAGRQRLFNQVYQAGGWWNWATGGPMTGSFTSLANTFGGEPWTSDVEDYGKYFGYNRWAEGICAQSNPLSDGTSGFLTSPSGRTYAHAEAEATEVNPCLRLEIPDEDNTSCKTYWTYRVSGEIAAMEVPMHFQLYLKGSGLENIYIYKDPEDVELEQGQTASLAGANMMVFELPVLFSHICINLLNGGEVERFLGRSIFKNDDDNPICSPITVANERSYQQFSDVISGDSSTTPDITVAYDGEDAEDFEDYYSRPGLEVPTSGEERDEASSLGSKTTTDTTTETSEEPAADEVPEEEIGEST